MGRWKWEGSGGAERGMVSRGVHGVLSGVASTKGSSPSRRPSVLTWHTRWRSCSPGTLAWRGLGTRTRGHPAFDGGPLEDECRATAVGGEPAAARHGTTKTPVTSSATKRHANARQKMPQNQATAD